MALPLGSCTASGPRGASGNPLGSGIFEKYFGRHFRDDFQEGFGTTTIHTPESNWVWRVFFGRIFGKVRMELGENLAVGGGAHGRGRADPTWGGRGVGGWPLPHARAHACMHVIPHEGPSEGQGEPGKAVQAPSDAPHANAAPAACLGIRMNAGPWGLIRDNTHYPERNRGRRRP